METQHCRFIKNIRLPLLVHEDDTQIKVNKYGSNLESILSNKVLIGSKWLKIKQTGVKYYFRCNNIISSKYALI